MRKLARAIYCEEMQGGNTLAFSGFANLVGFLIAIAVPVFVFGIVESSPAWDSYYDPDKLFWNGVDREEQCG